MESVKSTLDLRMHKVPTSENWDFAFLNVNNSCIKKVKITHNMFFWVNMTKKCNGNNIKWNKQFFSSEKGKKMKRTFLKCHFFVIVRSVLFQKI